MRLYFMDPRLATSCRGRLTHIKHVQSIYTFGSKKPNKMKCFSLRSKNAFIFSDLCARKNACGH